MILTIEEMKDIVERAGGVHEVSVRTGLRTGSLYRILQGTNKPSYDTLAKLQGLNDELINS